MEQINEKFYEQENSEILKLLLEYYLEKFFISNKEFMSLWKLYHYVY